MGRKQILITGSGGGGTPGGSNTNLQYNNAGAFGGFADGTSTQVLHGGRTFGAVVLTTDVSGVLPAANGGLLSLTTAAQGYFWGVGGASDSTVTGTATAISPTGANNVLAFQFVLPYGITVRKISFRNGATVTGSATASFGIYDIGGSVLIDSGVFSTAVASQSLSNTLGAAVTLAPGIYWFAQACTNSTNDAAGSITFPANPATYRNINSTRQGVATNAYAAGSLPPTLGVVTGFANRTPVPVLFEA